MAKYKGLAVGVYESKSIGNCSADGITSKNKNLILIGPGVPEIFEGDETNTVKLVERDICGNGRYLHAEPVSQPEGMAGPMMGGAFIYTSDSRFPSKQPIPVHDRFESWSDYEHLSR